MDNLGHINKRTKKDWPTGGYFKTCYKCSSSFTGHKREFICYECDNKKSGVDIYLGKN